MCIGPRRCPPVETKHLKSKICLVGEEAVGKTSLIRRFVLNMFDDRYITTIGTKVSKKEVRIVDSGRDLAVQVDISVWDIMGQKGFRELLKDAYFYGANAILAVADMTRDRTLDDLDDWIDNVFRVVGRVPVVVAVNKADLGSEAKFDEKDVAQFAEAFGSRFLYTSAKTGRGVEDAFRILGDIACREQLKLQPA